MKNNTNIYDIDNELIRKAGDNHEFTIQEVQEKLKHYRERLEEEQKREDADPRRIASYNTYIRNLSNYLAVKMTQLSNEEIADLIGVNNLKKTTTEEVENALNDTRTGGDTENEIQDSDPTIEEDNRDEKLGNDDTLGRGDSDIQEGRPITQDDLLVERPEINDKMDEYVEFEEA